MWPIARSMPAFRQGQLRTNKRKCGTQPANQSLITDVFRSRPHPCTIHRPDPQARMAVRGRSIARSALDKGHQSPLAHRAISLRCGIWSAIGGSGLWQAVRPADLWVHGLDHDPIRLNRIMISSPCLSMMFSENRFPPFRIMPQRGGSATSDERGRPETRARCYLTSFSEARRRSFCGDFGSSAASAESSSGTIASHNAFKSRSET